MARRTVLIAVLLLAVALGYSTAITLYSQRETIKRVTRLMEGLRLYVATTSSRA